MIQDHILAQISYFFLKFYFYSCQSWHNYLNLDRYNSVFSCFHLKSSNIHFLIRISFGLFWNLLMYHINHRWSIYENCLQFLKSFDSNFMTHLFPLITVFFRKYDQKSCSFHDVHLSSTHVIFLSFDCYKHCYKFFFFKNSYFNLISYRPKSLDCCHVWLS